MQDFHVGATPAALGLALYVVRTLTVSTLFCLLPLVLSVYVTNSFLLFSFPLRENERHSVGRSEVDIRMKRFSVPFP